MAIRNVVQVGDDILRKKCFEVENFDEKLWQLLDDMKDTVRKEDGAGLAAPQVGVLRRVVVIDIGNGLVELINPEILETKGEKKDSEGCLSIPGATAEVIRPSYVKVKALNRNGEEITVEGKDLMARALCHEIDHLDGILYVDKAVGKIEY